MTKKLTSEQLNIVNHDTGHALVKAVPGSGKTTTLVKRIERLVRSGHDPRSILILMYNKSAQVSFSEKLKLALKSNDIPEVRTFHSLALKIVRYAERNQLIPKKKLLTPDNPNYTILVKDAYRQGFQHETSYIEPNELEEFELFITRCRASGVTPTDAATDPTFKDVRREIINAYRIYCELLETNKQRTFDDCLIEVVFLLRKYNKLGSHFKHIIIDEYQDVNLIQHKMIRYLSGSDTSVMAVGDINQCIYEWRGARPDFIGGLYEKHFVNTKIFHLSCTFRFGHQLSLMANSVIRRNSAKLSTLCISHPSNPKTEVIFYQDDCLTEALIDLSQTHGTKAILARTKADLAEAELALRLCGIPYQYLNGTSTLHGRTEVGLLVIGFLLSVYGDLRLIENHKNKQAFIYGFLKECGFRWQKGQMKVALSELMLPKSNVNSVIGNLLEFDISSQNQIHLKKLMTVLNESSESDMAFDVLERLKTTGYLNAIGTDGVKRTDSNDRIRGIVRIEELLRNSKMDSKTFLKLIIHPQNISIDNNPFALATLHGSKGLEWDSVALIGLKDKEYPGGNVNDINYVFQSNEDAREGDDSIEEERRLFYVGMTRTKQRLSLVIPYDDGLNRWLSNRWDSSPKKPTIATRFVYEAGCSSCLATSEAIYNNEIERFRSKLSKFHQWYIKDQQRIKI